jgi:hypothetical protein
MAFPHPDALIKLSRASHLQNTQERIKFQASLEHSQDQVESMSEDAATPPASGTHLILSPFVLGSLPGSFEVSREPRRIVWDRRFTAR